MKTGVLNSLVSIQVQSGQDALGQPNGEWIESGKIWANVAGQSGISTIKTAAGDLPASVARYSVMVSLGDVKRLGIDSGHRLVFDGLNFDIQGVVRDLSNRDKAYLICGQGGNNG